MSVEEPPRDSGLPEARTVHEPGRASLAEPAFDIDGGSLIPVQAAGHQDDIPSAHVDALGIEVQRAAFAIGRRLS